MSRSIGDRNAKEIGVIATPDVLKVSPIESQAVFLLATDGVFDMLPPKDLSGLATILN